jgi:hypothetical protein
MNLAGDEWDVYEQLYNVLADRNPVPDLVVYLRADTDLLMMRIAMRDRAYEREMDRAYIESLRQVYERFFADYTRTPLLVINAKDLDYVQDPGALAFIEGQVRTALGIGVYQQTLPQMESAGAAAEEAESPLAEAAGPSPEWVAVEEFLAANAALGQLGTILAGGTAGWSSSLRVEMRAALEDTLRRLERIAQVVEEG